MAAKALSELKIFVIPERSAGTLSVSAKPCRSAHALTVEVNVAGVNE